jgi:hypothetical protein
VVKARSGHHSQGHHHVNYQSKLSLTKPGDSWGEAPRRTHQQESELVAEAGMGWVTFSIKQGAVNAPAGGPEPSRLEQVAAITLTRAHARALAAFLNTLPEED